MGLNVLFLESFYGGSHRRFADGFAAHSKHRVTLYTMPPRFWKWRTRGAAPHFATEVEEPGRYDLIFATDLLNLAELRGIWPAPVPPALLYFHENQLLYPLSPGEKRDVQYGLTDMLSALAADQIVFNSETHRSAFFAELPEFLDRFPDYPLSARVPELQQKSSVLYPGIEPVREPETEGGAVSDRPFGTAPLIIWNHRWEHDKNPEGFFRPLFRLAEKGLPFRVALLGERFRNAPEIFSEARDRLGERIVRYGYAEDREEYRRLLQEGDIVVSTAWQENFGLAVVEAIRSGCRPLLPKRLSYPELIPEQFHSEVLYESEEELQHRLQGLLESPKSIPLPALTHYAARFEWPRLIEHYDSLCEELV